MKADSVTPNIKTVQSQGSILSRFYSQQQFYIIVVILVIDRNCKLIKTLPVREGLVFPEVCCVDKHRIIHHN